EPDQFMSILSTLYYKGAWIDEFDKENNTEEIFHGINGDQKTEFMNQTLQTLYVDAKEYEAVGLGIEHSGTFWIVLPKKDMASVWEDIEKPTGEMMEVNLSMPKFDIENTLSLKDTLKKMGMSDVFDPEKADFAPLTDTPVYLSEVEHGVRVKTDEKGIEAAAYTKMDIDAMALIQESVDFKVDRPFIFAVQSQDGSILFCGQVTELS
ncbi:serpin family protein, partial [uncultured Dubosiella sp.]